MFWWTGPGDEPTDLPDRLQAHGFAANIVGDPGMAFDLDTLEQPSLPPGLTIVRATDRRTLEDWRDVFVAAYEFRALRARPGSTRRSASAQRLLRVVYVGYLDGEPVALMSSSAARGCQHATGT
ncbi:MAG: hypothetical protein KIS91_03910 [Anaerolineae bacterium]|nr:hypothetical protein [Anaerolineae bacterium]